MANAIRHSLLLHHARCEMRWKGKNVAKLIIGIGQVHPILSGTFSRRQARQIADTQAWIFELCKMLTEQFHVQAFGQEGLWAELTERSTARMDPSLLARIEHAPEDAREWFRRTAEDWRSALERRDADGAAMANALLNGLTMLQALHPTVGVFPIEQQDVHGRIGEGMNTLRVALAKVESSELFRSVRAKQGRGLTREEVAVVHQRNGYVHAFDKLLNHPERDRSIFREIHLAAERMPVVIFVLGQAHRHRQLRLARKHLDDGMLFLWITPPQLWARGRILHWAGWILGLLLIVGGILSTFLQ